MSFIFHEEVNAAIKCLISTNVTMGPINKNFEKNMPQNLTINIA